MEVLLTVLAGLGCLAMMGAATMVLPRIAGGFAEAPESGG
jgi:hypothetical protein